MRPTMRKEGKEIITLIRHTDIKEIRVKQRELYFTYLYEWMAEQGQGIS